jgi:hypothetical protein
VEAIFVDSQDIVVALLVKIAIRITKEEEEERKRLEQQDQQQDQQAG